MAPAGIETFDPWHLPLINTLILLCSGAAATWAHHAIAHENNRKDLVNGLIISILLGVLFTIFKLMNILMQLLVFRVIFMVLTSLWQLVFMVFMLW